MITSRLRQSLRLLQHRNHCFFELSPQRTCTTKSLFRLLVQESKGKKKELLGRIEKDCRPDVTSRLKQIVSDLQELKDLEMLIQKEGHGATKITSDFEHEIQCLESTFRTEIEPELLQDLTRDQDSLIDKLLLEVSCGVGGQEAMLFASELFNLYERYCIFKNWTFSSINCDSSNLGGIRSASVQISGTQCFYHLRNEAGVHRVQRIPLTEKSGRVHTSTAAVHVIPVDNRQGSLSVIDERDVKMTTKRATGAGGQHVNKTESAVVLTHVPTNTVVECQEERHQYLNREKAMQKLQMILTLKERERIIDNYERTKTTQVPSKDRNQKIRTYNFPQDRITDHRLSDNIHNIRSMMEGNDVSKLEEIIKRLNDNAKKQVIDNLIKELYCK